VLAVSDSINAAGENGKSATVADNSSNGSFFNQYQGFAGPVGLTPANLMSSGAGGAGSLFLLTTVDPSDTAGTITNLGGLSLRAYWPSAPPPRCLFLPAVWLFGSALATLLGLGHRGRQS
jgi:hypothetical protein